MTKEEVQSRVSHNGKPLPLEDFDWNKKARVFSSRVNGLVLDFKDVNGVTFKTDWKCTFNTGSKCTFKTSSHCTFTTGNNCTFKTDWNCTFTTGNNCTFNTDDNCTFKTDWNCKFNTDWNCTFYTGYDCMFKTNDYCTFKTSSHCTFDTGSNCTFNTSSNCTFKTDWNCTFDTGGNCTFKTSCNCTFNTYSNCIFNIDEQCVIIRRDIYEVISNKKEIQLCPYNIKGYLEKIDDAWYLNGDTFLGEHILTDNILSKVISKNKLDNGIVYRVYNYTAKGMSETLSYIVGIDGIYSHGSSIKDAKDSIMYKMVDRDTSAYTDMTLDTTYTIPEAIRMYRTITGACSEGVKMFVDGMDNVPDTISVKDILDITSGRYGHEKLKEYIDKTK